MKFEKTAISSNLETALTVAGMSQADLARASGIERVAISRISSGQTRSPQLTTIAALARALGVTAECLKSDPPISERDLRILRAKKAIDDQRQAEEFARIIADGAPVFDEVQPHEQLRIDPAEFDRLDAFEKHLKQYGEDFVAKLAKLDRSNASVLRTVLGLPQLNPPKAANVPEPVAIENQRRDFARPDRKSR